MQLDADYGTTDERDDDFCYKFEAAMKEGPIRAFEEISRDFPEVEGLSEKLGLRRSDIDNAKKILEREKEKEVETEVKLEERGQDMDMKDEF